MLSLLNFFQIYMPCRRHSLKYCNSNMHFLQRMVIRVQNQNFFSKYLSLICFFSCSRLWESSQQLQLWYHFVFKVNFEEDLLPSKIVLRIASSVALIQRCSLIKYGTSTGRFTFKIVILSIFWKFLEKHQQQSSYSIMSFQCVLCRKWCYARLIMLVPKTIIWRVKKIPYYMHNSACR